MQDGSEIKGTLKDIDRKDGLIKFVKIVDGAGVKHKLKPTSIKYMYLPPSGIDKLAKATSFVKDAKKWNNEKLNQDFLNQGYIYFETTDVKIKKKAKPLLMQLLNPTFCKEVKIYHDPHAKKTTSMGVAGVTLAGGLAKSYYIQLSTDPAAYMIKKKKYKKEFSALWNKCSDLSGLTDGVRWENLTDHIIQFTECK